MKTLSIHGILLILSLGVAFLALPKSGITWLPVGLILFAVVELARSFFRRNIRTRFDEPRPPKY